MLNLFNSGPKNYEDLDGKNFKEKFGQNKNAELLDVRTAGEFASGSIPGARNLDVTSGQLQNALPDLDKSKEYFLFCRSGARSGSACQLMSDKGYKVYNLQGGIGSWPR